MNEIKNKTVSDLKKAIKDLPDGMKICFSTEYALLRSFTIQKKKMHFYDDKSDNLKEFDTVVICLT